MVCEKVIHKKLSKSRVLQQQHKLMLKPLRGKTYYYYELENETENKHNSSNIY